MQNMAKVLLADANEEFRALLAGAIEKTGEFTVVGSTGDGAEALRLVEERKPDLLILDTVLPGMDGFGLLSRLPELGGPRAIVLSGFFSDRAATEALRLGAEYYLTKPCQMDALLERMRAALERGGAQEQTQDLVAAVTAIIHEIGVPAHIKGYQYLRHAIVLTVRDMDLINAVTKVLYPAVAKSTSTPRPPGWSGPSATPLRWPGTGATWRPCRNTSATPFPTPRASPPTPSSSP